MEQRQREQIIQLSHKLKTPLTIIEGNAELLAEDDGLTAEQIQGLTVLHSLNNFIPVTIGNILGGMVFVGIPCYFIYKKKWQKWHEESKNA